MIPVIIQKRLAIFFFSSFFRRPVQLIILTKIRIVDAQEQLPRITSTKNCSWIILSLVKRFSMLLSKIKEHLNSKL